MTRRSTFGPAYKQTLDRERLLTQMDTIRDVMLSANECRTWMTLRQISLLTGYGEASISSQLRHLRKRRFGGYVVLKQRRGEESGLWEYQVHPAPVMELAKQAALFPGGPLDEASA